jgi:lipopolysaccharide/colanic/teichoic acid biosynthesis glycosyltransferase
VAVLGIQAFSPGPFFFRQPRIGLHGKAFRMWKLRTMSVDAEARLAALLSTDAAACTEWQAFGRLEADPRIAGPFARWARSMSVDELPQLINILAGDMAWVGPRPILPDQAASLDARVRSVRESVRPGLTGLWQVRGRSDTSLKQMVRLDKLYVRRRSVRLDLQILAATPMAVISARGAY